MINFCTYFDINYFHRGIALYSSLCKTESEFKLWILCFDNTTYELLLNMKLANTELIHWQDFELGDDELQAIKKTRTRVEYFWTCTPSFLLFILKKYANVDKIIYVDADIYFFSSLSEALKNLVYKDILIVPHDYSPEFKDHESSGKYNVGLMVFNNNEESMLVLKWWRSRCIEWCYNRHENGNIGDQGYLNDWPERFNCVSVSDHKGLNAAPWNISKYLISTNSSGLVFISGEQLICYHFHGIQFCTEKIVFIIGNKVNLSKSCKRLIYLSYLKLIFSLEKEIIEKYNGIKILRVGLPWRYIFGRIFRFQSVKHFTYLK